MKRCPTCQAIYAEEVLLCAFDQSPLVAPEDVFVPVAGSGPWTVSPGTPTASAPATTTTATRSHARLPLRRLPEVTGPSPLVAAPPAQRTKRKTLLLWLSSLGKGR